MTHDTQRGDGSGHHSDPAPGRAAILGHPIHPMLIPFPIAFLVGAFLTDLAWWITQDPFWARGSYWLLLAGLVTGLVAAAAGLVDFVAVPRAREHRQGWFHLIANTTVLVLAGLDVAIRVGAHQEAVLPWGVVLSGVAAGALAVGGWTGGELPYRHLIGVTGH